MNTAEFNNLREIIWQRPLNQRELTEVTAFLSTHPELGQEWETDLALAKALRDMPDTPVASNFTSLVMQAVEQESKGQVKTKPLAWINWGWQKWIPRFAVAACVVGIGFMGYKNHMETTRTDMAISVKEISRMAALSAGPHTPPTRVWQDFEAIRELNTARPDVELLTLLQ